MEARTFKELHVIQLNVFLFPIVCTITLLLLIAPTARLTLLFGKIP